MNRQVLQRNKDAGFSLIELIVVVMIMAILAGGSLIGMSQVMNTNVTTSAEKLKKLLDRTRYENLYQEGEISLTLLYSDGHYYAVSRQTRGHEEIEREREELGGKQIEIYVEEKGGTQIDIRNTPVTIRFDKSSGAMKGSVYSAIRIENPSKKAELILVEHTGRCFLNFE